MEAVSFNSAMIVLDEKNEAADRLVNQLRQFLAVLNTIDSAVDISVVDQSQYTGVGSLLDLIRGAAPDLICSYRNLQIPAMEFPYSLGVFVDVITQATSIPVLLFPRPELAQDQDLDLTHPRKVMAVTDHLAGDSHLVTYAAKFTENGGTLLLTHVEDQKTFERYIETIGKIPEIDTDVARETIMDQLLKEPRDYIESCRKGIKEAGLPITVDSIVTVGHHLSDYRNLIRDNECNLLVLNTKDEDQLAMHGLAYPLSVELREIPMLLV
jgi:hypothetical protein